MGAQTVDLPLVQHQYPVRPFHGRQPLGDDKDGGAGKGCGQGLPDGPVRPGIHCRSAVVQDQDLRPFQKGPGNAQPLFLAPGQVGAPLPDPGIVPFGQPPDEFVRTGLAAGFFQLGLGGPGIPPPEVVRHSAGKQQVLLEHHGHAVPEGCQIIPAHVHAPHPDGALRCIIEPGDQLDQGGFPAAGAPHDAHDFPAPDGQGDVPEHRFPGTAFILEGNLVERHRSVLDRFHRLFRRSEGAFFLQHFPDPLDRFFRKGQHHQDHGHHHQGPQDLEAVGEQGGKLTDVQQPATGGEDQPGALGQKENHDSVDADLHQGIVQGHDPFPFGEQGLDLPGGCVEFSGFRFFPDKGFHHPDALDVFFHFVVQGIVLGEPLPEQAQGPPGDLVQAPAQHRDHHQKAQGHPASHVPGHEKGGQQVEGGPESCAHQHHEGHLDVLDVRGEPGHQRGGREPVDVPEGKLLDLAEHVLAEIPGKAAGGPGAGDPGHIAAAQGAQSHQEQNPAVMEDPVQAAAILHLVDQKGDLIGDQGLEHHFPHHGDGSQQGIFFEFPEGPEHQQPGIPAIPEIPFILSIFLFHTPSP